MFFLEFKSNNFVFLELKTINDRKVEIKDYNFGIYLSIESEHKGMCLVTS